VRRQSDWELDLRACLWAAIAGLLCGVIAVLLRVGLSNAEAGRQWLLAWLATQPRVTWIGVPIACAVCAGVAGWLVARFVPEASGSGIPHVEHILEGTEHMRWQRLLPVKFFGGLLALGSGMSLGREGPTVQMGAAVADAVARAGGADVPLRHAILAAGAGAGLTAAFNAPLAGFVFVVEELRRPFCEFTYTTGLIATLAANVVMIAVLGAEPAFQMLHVPPLPTNTLPLFAGLGVVAGLLGVVFNASLFATIDGLARIPGPSWARAIVAGLAVGAMALAFPAATGDGESVASTILQGHVPSDAVTWLVVLIGAKLFLTVVSYASAVPGGLFAPLLLLGAALGAIASRLLGVDPGSGTAFVIAGMVGVFTGSVRVPITGVVLLLEMTNSHHLVLQLTTTAVASYFVAAAVGGEPVYDVLRARDEERAERARQ
jgi:CIC family chloride channel protein